MRSCTRLQWRGTMLPAVGALTMLVTACLSSSPTADKSSATSTSQPSAGDWPLFGGTPSRNMVNTVDKNLPVQKSVKWVADLGTTSYGGPVVAGGKVFVGTNNGKARNPKITGDKGIVMAFRESDGQFLWQATHDKLPSGMENDWPQQGIASTPVIDGHRLYYVSNDCNVICADTEGFLDGKNDGVTDEKFTGKADADIVWRLDMIKELGVYPCFLASCSPLVAGDLLFVVTGNGVNEKHAVQAPKAPAFLALNKKTGQVVWQNNLPGDKILEGQWSNPVYAEINGKAQVIFPGGDGWLYAFEPATGHLIWKFDCNPRASEYKPEGGGTRNYLVATPVVYDNKVFIGVGQKPDAGSGVGHLWCIDATRSGDLTPVDDNFDAHAAANKNSGLVWHFGGAAPPGSERDFVFGRTISTCAIQDDLVYIGEIDGFLHCLDARSGQQFWEHDLKAGIWGSPYCADGKVYIGNEDGDLYVFAQGKEKKLIGKIEIEEPIKSTVVAAHGVLYLLTDKHLYALASK